MMLWDLLSVELSPIDQWRQLLGIAMNEDITWPVRIVQLCLLLGWVLLVHQAALVHATPHLVWACVAIARNEGHGTTPIPI
jgi:hypothetical protein